MASSATGSLAKSRLALALPAAAALAASVLGALPAHAADREIASSGAFVSPVEAYGGNVVWGEVAVGRSGFAYFVRDAKGTRALALEDRVSRVDLGARRGGGTRAVFVRCPRPSTLRTPCVIRGYDFRTCAMRTVSSLLRLPGTEGVPSVWNDRFAFTRSGRGLFVTGPLRAVTRAKPSRPTCARRGLRTSPQFAPAPKTRTGSPPRRPWCGWPSCPPALGACEAASSRGPPTARQ